MAVTADRTGAGDPARWVGHSLNTGGIFTAARLFCRVMPAPLLYLSVRATMALMGRALRSPREAVRANLRAVRPGADEDEIRLLVGRTFQNYGRCTADFLRYSHRPQVPIERLFSRVEGMETCRRILEKGKGIIMATAHLGNWELGGIVFSRFGYPINVLAMAEQDPTVEQIRRDNRGDRGIRTLYVGQDLSTLFRVREVLGRGEVVALLAERHHGRDRIDVEFFGRTTSMVRSPALISRFSGAPIMPCAVLMDGNGRYQALVSDAVEPPGPEESEAESSRRMIQALAGRFEAWIRDHPDQWFNFYPYWEDAPAAGGG